MPRCIVLEEIGKISCQEIRDEFIYKPTREEEIAHGTRVVTRQNGDPGEGEIEVEALMGAVCTHEVSLYLGDLTHPRYPMIPGHEAVHRVTRVGKGVTHVKEGDYVAACWYMGQWSQKVIGPANVAHRLPVQPGDELEKWIVEPAASIVNAMSYMDIKPGSKVLLIGAGFMGQLMIQLMHGYPMTEFVVSDPKPFSREMALRSGAFTVVDPLSEPEELSGHTLYDSVIECSGTQAGLDTAISLSGMASSIYLFGWHRKQRTVDFKLGHLRGQKFFHTSPAIDDGREYERYWPTTIRLIERGAFNIAPLVTHRYQADDIRRAMDDSVTRENGFLKSVIHF